MTYSLDSLAISPEEQHHEMACGRRVPRLGKDEIGKVIYRLLMLPRESFSHDEKCLVPPAAGCNYCRAGAWSRKARQPRMRHGYDRQVGA